MARGAIIGTADPAQFSNTTSTFSSSNGTWYFPMVAAESGVVDTILARMNAWNTTTQAKFGIADNVGNILAVGTAINTNGLNVSLSVTPFNAAQGQTYFGFMIAASGSPRPYQDTSAITNQVKYIAASTFAATQNPLQMGTATQSALRKFHIWAEGEIGATSAISNVNGGNPVIPSQAATWTATGFAPNSATLDGIACLSVSSLGFTPPGYADEANNPRPGSRLLVASEGANTASATVPVGVIPGYKYQTLASVSAGLYSVVKDMDADIGDFVVYPDADGNNVTDAGELETNHEGSQVFWLIKGDTGYGLSYNVLTGPGGEIIEVSRSLTAKSLTMSGLTMRSLTASGL